MWLSWSLSQSWTVWLTPCSVKKASLSGCFPYLYVLTVVLCGTWGMSVHQGWPWVGREEVELCWNQAFLVLAITFSPADCLSEWSCLLHSNLSPVPLFPKEEDRKGTSNQPWLGLGRSYFSLSLGNWFLLMLPGPKERKRRKNKLNQLNLFNNQFGFREE